MSARRRLRPVLIAIFSVAAFAATAGTASAISLGDTPVPTWQANGRVNTIIRVNNVIYIGGQFTSVMDNTGGTITPRNRLAAFDASTGQVLPWNPGANSTVRTLATSQDGSLIFVGGSFTTVGGKARLRAAAVQAANIGAGTGVVTGWAPRADAAVWSLAILNGRVYMGGEFGKVNGHTRARVAAVSASTGALSTTWVPKANKVVRSIVVGPTGTTLYVGGYFTQFDRKNVNHLAAVSPLSGKLLPWLSHPPGGVKSLTAVSGSLFVGDAGGGGHVRSYVLPSGKLRWTNTANGDVERVVPFQGDVIAGGHFTVMGAFTAHHLVALNQKTGKVDPTWRPSANSIHGVFSIGSYGQNVYTGGDFTAWFPGAVPQAHFAQFTIPVTDTTPPNVTMKPRLIVGLGAQLGPVVVPTHVSYSAVDVGPNSICRYQLQKSFGGGAFGAVSLPWITAPFANLQIAPSTKGYVFQLKATDCVGNASAFVPANPVVLSAIQDGSRSIHYKGRWAGARVPGTYGGSIRTTSQAGASATMTFKAREVVLIASRAPNRGMARIYIDGHLVKTQDLHASITIRRRAVFTRAFSSVGTHTIKVVAVGTKGHPTIDVDAFLTVR